MASSLIFCEACGAANQPQASLCHICGRLLQASGTTSPTMVRDTVLTDEGNGLIMQSFQSMSYEPSSYDMGYKPSSYEERSPYSYNPSEQSFPDMLTSQRATRKPRRSIQHTWAFFGGLAIQVEDILWFALINHPGNDGSFNSNPLLNGLAIFCFVFAIGLLVTLVSTIIIALARSGRWGWFIGLLLGSLAGTATFFLSGVALIVFGLAAPRIPRAVPK